MPLNNITINGQFRYAWFGSDLPVPMWNHYMTIISEDMEEIPFDEVAAKFLVAGRWGKFPTPKPTPTKTPTPTVSPTVEPTVTPTPTPTPTDPTISPTP
jgi:hypothetical protein